MTDASRLESTARGVLSTLAAMIVPCSVKTYGRERENLSCARWSQFVTTCSLSAAVS